MKSSDIFIKLCSRVISDNAAGLVDIHLAAEKISKQANELPFEDDAHPMLHKVSDLSFDIAENFRSDAEDVADWETVIKTVKSYSEGNWESTCWILGAMYGEYTGSALTHSYSVAVRRQNGGTIIETASTDIEHAFTKIVKKINVEQTDERYLQNFAKCISANIKNYKLVSVDIEEHLIKSYYSAA